MLRLQAQVVVLLFIFINAIYGQVDPAVCPDGLSTGIQDPNWRTIPNRFEIMTELVAGDGVMEVSQAFSETRDAVAANSRSPFEFYWNFVTNEKFTVLHVAEGSQTIAKCLRDIIQTETQTSVIVKDSLILKPSVILGFDARNQRNANWGLLYIGDGELRGIPTNQFKSCFFVNDIKATVSVAYHVSDVKKFHAYLPSNESIILQLNVNISSPSKPREQYQYNVFRYSPNPSRREERQALETPAGLYCPGRNQTIAVPSNIPGRASANSEVHIPTFNSTIFSTHTIYDTEFEFTQFDAWYPDVRGGGPAWYHMTELHDFAVGLSYHFNHTNRQCRVSDITPGFNDAVSVDGSSNVFQMGNPQHLFLMDDITYQYTGEKRCRDRVWCHVWIGEKPMPNNTVEHREWYWASRVNDVPLTQYIPTKLIIKRIVADIPVFVFESSIFNFRRNPMTIFEIDYTLAECYRALGPAENYNLAVLSFKVDNPKNFSVSQNLNSFRFHVWETLLFAMFVRPTRLSHLIVDQDGTDIIVTFTLLDAPPRTGPVENPLKESSLDTIVERLTKVIDSNNLAFRARTQTRTVVVRARSNSLNIHHRTTTTIEKTTGPRITGLWIGLIIAGIVVGVIGGFFIFEKISKK